ncbi:hypothetical protein BH24ACT9_BH24ACT9_11600 [soil metagenome]
MTSRAQRGGGGERPERGEGCREPAPGPDTGAGGKDGADPGGPLGMVCLGHRCAALHTLAQEVRAEPGLPALTEVVRSTRGAILVTTGCVGHCELGAVVALGRRPASTAAVATEPGGVLPFTGGVVLAGMDRAPRAEAMRR